ncbi:MAG: hypothetical protein ACLFRG_15035 [Desulfococcaceae bacterium]
MKPRHPGPFFTETQLEGVRAAVGMAEDRVSDFYKLSDSQWFRYRYDVRTLAELEPEEVVDGPFAQVIRYEARPADASLGSSAFDFYRICLLDHAILPAVAELDRISLRPFLLYLVTHELVHVVRFCRFLQNFNASEEEKRAEEQRVHRRTLEILERVRIVGMSAVLDFFRDFPARDQPLEVLR